MFRVKLLLASAVLVCGWQASASPLNKNAPYKHVYCSGYLNQTDYFTVFSSVFYSKAEEEVLKKAMLSRVQAKYPNLKNITCYATSTDSEEYATKLLNSAKANSKRKANLDFSY